MKTRDENRRQTAESKQSAERCPLLNIPTVGSIIWEELFNGHQYLLSELVLLPARHFSFFISQGLD